MSFWDKFLCRTFKIRCPEKPPETIFDVEYCDSCSETGLRPNTTCKQVYTICPYGECPREICEINHDYAEPPKIVTRTICLDSNLIRRKHCVNKRMRQFIQGAEPLEKCDLVEHKYKRTLTKYLWFDNAKVWAGVSPGDLFDLNQPYHDGFTKENWVQVAEALAQHNVNGKRHFLHTGEEDTDLSQYLVPFKRLGKEKFDLWNLDPVEWGEILWKLQRDLDRGIIPMICLASGWKGFRYDNTAWHPKHNIGVKRGDKTIYMTSDHRKLLTDPDSGRIYRGVAEMITEALRDLKHPTGIKDPFIIEGVNEYDSKACGDKKMFEWFHALFSMLENKMKLDPTRMAFEKWNSKWIGVKKIDDEVEPGLMDLFPGIFCTYHGQNTYEQAVRWHKGEMGKIHNAYPGLLADGDGTELPEFPPEGLMGKNWSLNFRRITPVELKKFLIYDYKHNGAGFNHLSAVQFFESRLASYESFVKAFVKGLTKIQLMEWQKMMFDYRGVLLPVDWEKFSYEKEGKRYALSEGKAIKQAMQEIHK